MEGINWRCKLIGSQLLRYADNQRYLLYDIESNGLNLHTSKPWQIAYAICTNKCIESINIRHILWKDLEMSDDAARVNRFDRQKYLSLAEDPDLVLQDFEKLLMDKELCPLGHNILGFDSYVVNSWRRDMGRKEDWDFVSRSIDTLCLSRAYRHQIVPDTKDFWSWQYKMLSLRSGKKKGMGASLGAMAREFQIEYDERYSHEASYDCRVNHQVFQKLLWSVEV